MRSALMFGDSKFARSSGVAKSDLVLLRYPRG